MEIDKNLEWEPSFDNQIDIEEGHFTITLTKKAVEIECNWDYGHGGKGVEIMSMGLEKLENLIKELKDS